MPRTRPAPAELILRLNEIFHDLETDGYDEKHPDILEDEIPRWHRFLTRACAEIPAPRQVLDIGSGTGFVPLRLREFLRTGDGLTCSDLSSGMLEICRVNLHGAGLDCDLRLLKLSGGTLPLPDKSQHLVTLNAVMHHLPEPRDLSREIDRVLKPGGWVLIGHEPTNAFARNAFLVCNYWLLLPIADPRQFLYEIILRLGWFEALRRPLAHFAPDLARHNRLLQKVNDRLLAEGRIEKTLPAAEISGLLDAQSPDAGGSRPGRGFSREIFAECFPGYRIESCETYNALHKIHPRGNWMKRYAAWLIKRFPESGSQIFCALRKPGK